MERQGRAGPSGPRFPRGGWSARSRRCRRRRGTGTAIRGPPSYRVRSTGSPGWRTHPPGRRRTGMRAGSRRTGPTAQRPRPSRPRRSGTPASPTREVQQDGECAAAPAEDEAGEDHAERLQGDGHAGLTDRDAREDRADGDEGGEAGDEGHVGGDGGPGDGRGQRRGVGDGGYGVVRCAGHGYPSIVVGGGGRSRKMRLCPATQQPPATLAARRLAGVCAGDQEPHGEIGGNVQ